MKQRWYARPLSLYLSIAIAFTSLIFTFAGGRQARAQQATRAPFWAVLDFTNTTKYGGSDIGREAGDALVIELGNSNRFNVITRNDVVNGLNTVGLQPPLDQVDIQRLGKQINADAVVTGEVLAVSQKTDPAQVQAVVAVKVTDVSTGELINGALAEGLSTPRPGAVIDQDTMVNEALSKAAFAAVKQITSYQLPEPTIINNEGPNTVLLNMGSRDGITPGMTMLVRRNNTEVGRIRVGEVEDDEASAVVTDSTLGIRPGDHARAVYSLPAYVVRNGAVVTDSGSLATGSAVQAKKHNAFSGVGGVILAILAAGLLVALVQHSGTNGGIGQSGGVTARAAWGVGIYNLSAFENFASVYAADAAHALFIADAELSYGNVITWSNGNINPNSILAFNIYRDGYTPYNPVNATTSSSSTTSTTTTTGTSTGSTGVVDIPYGTGPIVSLGRTTHTFTDTGAGQFPGITVQVVDYNGIASTAGSTSSSTSTSGSTSSGSSSSSSSSTGSSSSSTSTSSVTTGFNYGTLQTLEYLGGVPGPALGAQTHYAVTAVYTVTIPTTTQTLLGYEETPVQTSTSGNATPLLPIDTTSNYSGLAINNVPVTTANASLQNVTLNVVRFAFNNTTGAPVGLQGSTQLGFLGPGTGANTFVIDFSDTQTFRKKVTIGPISDPGVGRGPVIGIPQVNLKGSFPNKSTIYYRIGARESYDSPGPVNDNAFTPNPDHYSGGGGYIYSLANTFSGS